MDRIYFTYYRGWEYQKLVYSALKEIIKLVRIRDGNENTGCLVSWKKLRIQNTIYWTEDCWIVGTKHAVAVVSLTYWYDCFVLNKTSVQVVGWHLSGKKLSKENVVGNFVKQRQSWVSLEEFLPSSHNDNLGKSHICIRFKK